MSIINKNILFLIKDLRTDNVFNQVVGKTIRNYKVNDYLDIRLDLPDNDKEWVLCRVVKVTGKVISIVIVKEI